MFVGKSVRELPQPMTQTDEMILQDKSLDYRVLNFASNTFNENQTSFYHKSIGGYHAAKLRRYQDLIETYIQPEMNAALPAIVEAQGEMQKVAGDSIFPVINMLNAKYFIMPLQGGQTAPLENPYAQGNAWYVNTVNYVADTNAEFDALAHTDLRHIAVATGEWKETLGESAQQDSTAQVTITAYQPNELKYHARSEQGGVIVFSEIFYPGWKATVDGKEVPLARVNYVLRAMHVDAGEHDIVLSFFPESVNTTETIAYVAMAVLLLAIVACALMAWRRRQQKPEEKKG